MTWESAQTSCAPPSFAPRRYSTSLAHIDSVWRELVPHSPIRREFMEARFRQMYELFEMANRVFVALIAVASQVVTAFTTEPARVRMNE